MSEELNELIKELGKIVDGNQFIVEELDKLKSLYEKLKIEATEEFEYPFAENEIYFTVSLDGDVTSSMWNSHIFDTTRYSQGNAFKTKQEAERERDKRILLTKFRQFRDKCNGDWKPDFYDYVQEKYIIRFNYVSNELEPYISRSTEEFRLFGYFKNHKDCKRAIQLFGDEIKRLFVEVEK